VENEMKSVATMLVHASSLEGLDKELNSLKVEHERLNPDREIEVKVINPDPKTVHFVDWKAETFTVSLRWRFKDDSNA
jgi:hypothetical protein